MLNLAWNELYMADCVAKIFQGVKNSMYIKEIDYSWNGLSGTDWVKSFKQALIKNKTLEILRMENNRLKEHFISGYRKGSNLIFA